MKIDNIDEWLNDRFERYGYVECEVNITREELIRAGLSPEEIGWKSLEQIKEEERLAKEREKIERLEKEKAEKKSKENEYVEISHKDIAEADKEQALTTTEVGGIKGIINKIKGFFKGKGEK